MKVIFSPDKNLLKTALVLSAAIFVICAIGLVKYISETSRYEKVSATITGVNTKYDTKTSNSQNRNQYVNYSFTYKGAEYRTKKLTVLPFLYKNGKTAEIRIDPQNPENMANPLFPAVYILTCVVCAALVFAVAGHLLKK